MKKILILATKPPWAPNYWSDSPNAKYPKLKYSALPAWNSLADSCPLPALGIYFRDYSREPFVYLKLKGMSYDSQSEEPSFDTQTIGSSNGESQTLIDKLPSSNKWRSGEPKYFSSIEPKQLKDILQELSEDPPEEWKKLIQLKEQLATWRDYVGRHFLEIEEKDSSPYEFEDRIAALLNSLNFDVSQKGHKLAGEYADGIASFEDYQIVYDCKNTLNFLPSADDMRAIQKYLSDEKKIRKEKNIFPAFIAKSFKQGSRGDVFYFTVGALIYLLYKRLSLGPKFTLAPIKKILENKTPLTNEIIDKEWRV